MGKWHKFENGGLNYKIKVNPWGGEWKSGPRISPRLKGPGLFSIVMNEPKGTPKWQQAKDFIKSLNHNGYCVHNNGWGLPRHSNVERLKEILPPEVQELIYLDGIPENEKSKW